jgi:hypothetical protein
MPFVEVNTKVFVEVLPGCRRGLKAATAEAVGESDAARTQPANRATGPISARTVGPHARAHGYSSGGGSRQRRFHSF